MNPSDEDKNTVSTYEMKMSKKIGNARDSKEGYDLINVTKICLGGENTNDYDNYDGVIKFLDIVFSAQYTAKQKMQILYHEYGIDMYHVGKDVDDMGEFSEYYFESGERKGIKEGMKQGIHAIIDMCKEFDVSKDEAIRRVEERFLLSHEEATDNENSFWS